MKNYATHTTYGGGATNPGLDTVVQDLLDRNRCPVRGTLKPFKGIILQPTIRVVKGTE